jgi:hypothetical protein
MFSGKDGNIGFPLIMPTRENCFPSIPIGFSFPLGLCSKIKKIRIRRFVNYVSKFRYYFTSSMLDTYTYHAMSLVWHYVRPDLISGRTEVNQNGQKALEGDYKMQRRDRRLTTCNMHRYRQCFSHSVVWPAWRVHAHKQHTQCHTAAWGVVSANAV